MGEDHEKKMRWSQTFVIKLWLRAATDRVCLPWKPTRTHCVRAERTLLLRMYGSVRNLRKRRPMERVKRGSIKQWGLSNWGRRETRWVVDEHGGTTQ